MLSSFLPEILNLFVRHLRASRLCSRHCIVSRHFRPFQLSRSPHPKSLDLRSLVFTAASVDARARTQILEFVVKLVVHTLCQVSVSFAPYTNYRQLSSPFSFVRRFGLQKSSPCPLLPFSSGPGLWTVDHSLHIARVLRVLYLEMRLQGGIQTTVRRFSELPGGFHFSRISVDCYFEDSGSTTGLLSKCSSTRESFDLGSRLSCVFPSVPVADRCLIAADHVPRHCWHTISV